MASNAARPEIGWRKGASIGPILLKYVGNGQWLASERADAFLKMVDDAAKDGVTIIANSGFRSMVQQTALYAAYVARGMKAPIVAKPGYSNHQAGDAVDIAIPPAGTAPDDPKRLASREYQWLKANAHKYGFFNDIAAHKEAWHWSPTGR